MLEYKELNPISPILIHWYQSNKRDLPWREIHDPYQIWISEIILQQTRVAQGFDYFVRFIHQFPDIKSLATAHEDEVLKCWQGLGYYSRARNLHAAAKQIMENFNGKFPSAYNDILSLKGIGEYTAAAVASFAFKLSFAVVDGNVFRFLSRYFGIQTPIDSGAGKKEFLQLADALLDKRQPDLHNQAIMEFGALQCTPTAPDCNRCPFSNSCFAKENDLISSLPVKGNKTKVTHRYFHHFIVLANGGTFLHKRTQKDIWQNLYEFPLYESPHPMELSDIIQTEWFRSLTQRQTFQIGLQITEIKHILSHQVIHASFFVIKIDEQTPDLPQFIYIATDKLWQYPVSKLTEKFIKKFSQNLDSPKNEYNFTSN
ncbi:MAG: A/G-specific DNA-adenine glycosylase [Bacteroidetes bacterium]|nr:A/G-specific DNA-adenine glycosylase [Bacteroidota bacterium]